MSADMILEAQDLTKRYDAHGFGRRSRSAPAALDGVSLAIRRGETIGLVGESGSGKSTLARVLLHLTPASSGRICFEGQDLATLGRAEMRRLRRSMQIVFQDPQASLNPRLRVRQTLGEAIRMAGGDTGSASSLTALLDAVGLPARFADSRPHELSGGQRQRVAIARALAVRPSFIVADEPVSALDVSVQAQILNLLVDLRESRGLTYLLISHDLAVIRYLAERIAVMYRGRIVELAPAARLFEAARHPYTQLLLASLPGTVRRAPIPAVEPRDSASAGCAFLARCPKAQALCRQAQPPLAALDSEHAVACFVASGA
jgi:oligopeptide/dipeptide ABC transporter ATP-binding protein